MQSERVPLMPPSLRKIFIEVCDRHGVKPSELAGRSMARKFVAARREFIWRSRRETRHTFSRIATAISRDHTTAVHQYHRVVAGVASIDPHVPNDLTIPRGREIEVTELRKAGVPWKEIAKRMGISENAVRSYHSIARRRMKMGVRDE